MPLDAHAPPRPHHAPVRIAGIDPGSHHTGWAVLDSTATALHYVDCGIIHADGDLSARLRAVADGLEQVLAVHRPAVVAVESIFHHRNSQSAITLGHARGVALLCIARQGARLAEYTPAEIKRAATGNGRASKEQVARMVRMMLGLRGELGFDASDALAIAICHAHRSPARNEQLLESP